MAEGGVVKYAEATSSPVLSMDIDDNNNVVLDLNVTDDNLTTPCTNDYCVSDEEYLNMIENYIKPSEFEWVLIALYFIVFVSITTFEFFLSGAEILMNSVNSENLKNH